MSRVKNKVNNDKIECLKCRKEKAASNYYMNTNPLFSSEKLEICKDCINDYIGEKGSEGYLNRVNLVLALLNKPFHKELWIQRGEDWAKYIPQLSTLHQYKGLTFADSEPISSSIERNDNIKKLDVNIQVLNENEYPLSEEVLRRWQGFNQKDIRVLEDFYQELIMNYEHGTPIQRNLYKNIAITQMKANIAITEGKNKEYKDLMDTLSKLMNDANIKPVQETGAEANGISSFGEFIKMIEETEPIPEPRDEFKDVDGIKKYIDKWFVHQFARVFGLTNDTVEEYDAKVKLENGDNNGRNT